ncbi:hypothetical protein ABT381_18280 [Streptomyces sp. NPDC000151]|uniref:OsmC family protein n=1 Tax=Streptomyces sp. NPDC000151 TaxID=3154244 RepID=UPI00332E7693
MAVEARMPAIPYQVAYRAGKNEGVADTCKADVGGSAGMRPHELLEAALATCMTITARMTLADLGVAGIGETGIGEAEGGVSARVVLGRGETATDFRYASPPFDAR